MGELSKFLAKSATRSKQNELTKVNFFRDAHGSGTHQFWPSKKVKDLEHKPPDQMSNVWIL